MSGRHDPATAWRWEMLEEVDSTNTLALERVRACWGRGESAEGIVVGARRQSNGKGQHGRSWESPAGGLYMSAVVENVPPGTREKLALLAGVAVVEALQQPETYIEAERARHEQWSVAAQIRWPNDVLVEGKKVAGILCEGLAQGNKWAAVIGIGINVATEARAFSEDVGLRATSLLATDGRQRTAEKMGVAILEQLDDLLHRARRDGLGGILEKVRAMDALKGKQIRFDAGGVDTGSPMAPRVFEADVEGIDGNGALVLRRVNPDGSRGKSTPFLLGSILL